MKGHLDYMKYKVEVIADNSGKWVSNGLRFDTEDAARVYGADLFLRWTAVQAWRVVEERVVEDDTEGL